MAHSDANFAGSIPAIYDRCLGPFIFEPYAQDLARRVQKLAPKRVLETAAGTGIVTRALAAASPSSAEIIATDLNQAMLDMAETKISARNVTWKQADAQALPFEAASFDLVVCQFGAMFFPDKHRAYGEARRVLREGGIFLFNVWDRIETSEIVHVIAEAVKAAFPDDSPRFLERTPYGYYDVNRIRTSFARLGSPVSRSKRSRRSAVLLQRENRQWAFVRGLRYGVRSKRATGAGLKRSRIEQPRPSRRGTRAVRCRGKSALM